MKTVEISITKNGFVHLNETMTSVRQQVMQKMAGEKGADNAIETFSGNTNADLQVKTGSKLNTNSTEQKAIVQDKGVISMHHITVLSKADSEAQSLQEEAQAEQLQLQTQTAAESFAKVPSNRVSQSTTIRQNLSLRRGTHLSHTSKLNSKKTGKTSHEISSKAGMMGEDALFCTEGLNGEEETVCIPQQDPTV